MHHSDVLPLCCGASVRERETGLLHMMIDCNITDFESP